MCTTVGSQAEEAQERVVKLAEAARYEAEQAATRREAEEERRRHQAAYLRCDTSLYRHGVGLPRMASCSHRNGHQLVAIPHHCSVVPLCTQPHAHQESLVCL